VTRRALGPVLLCLVLGAALLAGSGVFDHSTAGPLARAIAIERDVRCPGTGCGDLSILQSRAPSSIALCNEIVAAVRHGQSTSAILATIVDRYGTSILLSPPGGGLDALLWITPALVAAIALGALVLLVLRRRRRVPDA
jgi:cytochrome c-type biogenesis protein CcmH/NrfF